MQGWSQSLVAMTNNLLADDQKNLTELADSMGECKAQVLQRQMALDEIKVLKI